MVELVSHLNAMARNTGVARSVLQFENISTHAQYAVPYAVTRRAITSGDRVLDWGCGNGHFSFFLASLGARITGYSFEPKPLVMEGSPCFEFVQGSEADPKSLPFANAMFDAAVGVGVLEHVWETSGDERASLAELARVIRPGGTLLTFHLPNRSGLVENTVKALRLNKYIHGRRFDEAEIRALWTEAGFTVTDVGLYNALPRAELRRLPGFLRHSSWFARTFGFVDDALGRATPSICTNYYVVATKH
jgi:SAM-dependent methyltransferase